MLERALNYPYTPEEKDFLFVAGGTTQLRDDSVLVNRKAVLAVGSNRSPEQLLRKFGDSETIPVTKARLWDYDVFYSAHVASYGSIPAVLGGAVGTVVDVFVTWLLPHQLQRMHETEAVGKSYDYAESSSLRIELGSNRMVHNIGCYLGRRGYANFDGSPVALKEVNALNRKVSSADQKTALTYFYKKNRRGKSFDKWLEEIIRNHNFRAQISTELASSAIKDELIDFEVK
ncbi:MAG: hypothetical protein MKZ89_03205 [Nisaea sp.]|nr:hypothetical protein [Nisaea sp.]|tara:strand:+ start:16 stop:708 length:693 start_codon:yes stop_codon:yes gene_type:complete